MPRRARRGAALVVTVLLSAVAASIVLVLLTQTLNSARTETARTDADTAARLAQEARVDFEKDLSEDPESFLRKVRSDERARLCVALPGSPVHAPGTSWPKECGGVWTYQAPSSPGKVLMELRPPSPADPLLQATILGRSGSAASGIVVEYRVDGAGRYSVWSESDLVLDDLSGGASTTSLSGSIYSAGTVFMPSTSSVQLKQAQVMSEADSIAGTLAGENVRFYAGVPNLSGTPPVQDVRSVVQSRLSSSGLAAAAVDLKRVACDPSAAQLPGSYSTKLCLTGGTQLVRSDGTSVTVPAGVKAYLLLFGETGAGTVNVYATTSAPAYTGSCMIRCDLPGLAAPEVAAGAHPGAKPYWSTSLGVFTLPATGAVFSDADVHVGLCGAAFLTPGATCTQVSGTAPGMAVERSATVLAGTPDQPRSIFVAGSVNAVGKARLGLFATGDVVLPYWSRPPQGALNVDAALLALGLGGDKDARSRSAIRTLPARTTPSIGATDNNYGSSVTVQGSVVAPRVSLDLGLFDKVVLENDTQLLRTPPPYLPGFDGSWEQSSSRRMTVEEIARLQGP